MTKDFARLIIVFLMAITASACAGGMQDAAVPPAPPGADPLNTTYTIEDRAVPLINGSFKVAAAPGSALMIKATAFGRPLFGDLDHDGDADAVVVILYESGGSGTFYYIAAAINHNGRYKGTAGYLLGDRILIQSVNFRDGLVQAHYLDRRPGQPLSVPPTVDKRIRMRFSAGKLTPVKSGAGKEQVLEGWVTIGHEVRSFRPCANNTEHWLAGQSPALADITAAYRKTLAGAKPYTPLFMSLAGIVTEPPTDGFGADFSVAFKATRLEKVQPAGNCRDKFIVVDSPGPGEVISSPLKVHGRARGTWFFEGDFPLILKDQMGTVIGKSYATAKGDWMTKDFVPFEGTITFEKPATGHRGTLVFKKDNPTDRPELDDAMELPVSFK